jgi:hypothetical protein
VGDFDLHSDVDWAVITEDELSNEQVNALQAMHGRIFQLEPHWAQHLEGSYFPKNVLRTVSGCGKPLWYLDNGSRVLIQSDHCNTVVVRWVLREKGVALAGPPPALLIDPISADTLRKDIFDTLNGWGREILDQPERYRNRFYQGYLVLNYCRMLHDLQNGTVGSKRAGAEWAKATLDPRWGGLIDRGWNGRPRPEVSIRQPADPEDFRATLTFIEYIMKASQRFADGTDSG